MWWLTACGPNPGDATDAPGPAEIYADDGIDIIRESFEDPTWTLGGISLFSAPIGTVQTGYAETRSSLSCILPQHSWDDETEWLAPIGPHVPPYDAEIFDGLTACARTSRNEYERSDFVGSVGLVLLFSMIPAEDAPTGRTTDSEEALPLVGTAFLPFDLSADLVQEGTVFFPDMALHGPRLTDLGMDGRDGLSHWPLALLYPFNETPEFVDLGGAWSWEVAITDEKGNGWNMTIPFTVSVSGSGT
jgi:hypothetical protein